MNEKDISINFFAVIYAGKQSSACVGYFVCCTTQTTGPPQRHFHKPNLVNNKTTDYKNKKWNTWCHHWFLKVKFEATNVGFHSARRALKMLFDGWLKGTNSSNRALQQTQRFMSSWTTRYTVWGKYHQVICLYLISSNPPDSGSEWRQMSEKRKSFFHKLTTTSFWVLWFGISFSLMMLCLDQV